jgi:Xaa-Pro aminopeptidase
MAANLLMHADSIRDPDLFAATGVSIVDPFVYLETDGRRVILTSTLEADAARRNSRATDVLTGADLGTPDLVREGMEYRAAELEGIRRLLERHAVADVCVPPGFPLATADFLRDNGVRITVDRDLYERRRRHKDDPALDGIRVAQRATERAFDRIRELLGSATSGASGLELEGEPLTCERLREAAEEALRRHGCGGEPPLVSSGPQNANVHEPGRGPVRPGESLIVDIFPTDAESRMCADMTRTFCYGPAPEWLRHMHATTLEALRRSTEAMTPGVAGRAVHDIACDVFEAAGYRTQRQAEPGEALTEDFFHGLGHGVGLEVHEAPGMGLGTQDTLEPGDVITVEPGVYRKQTGGVRLEDLVLVTDSGHQVLTDYDYQLEIRP